MKRTPFKPKPTGICKGCGREFQRFRTTDKYCSPDCQEAKPKQAPRPPIRKVSPKMAKATAQYLRKRQAWLQKPENKYCRVYPHKLATDVHHMKGRMGDLLLDERYWLPVSREGHRRIEENPEWAKEKGFSLSRLALD